MYWYAWFIFISPLIGFVLSYTVGRYHRWTAGVLASITIFLSLVFSIITFFHVRATGQPVYNSVEWFYNIHAGVYVDQLTLVMAIMVSFVSLMIHLFALYYMGGDDPNKHVYFAETSLFTAGMLGLVVASNLVLFFLFWELVGLCSYLLIGFWFFKPNAASAAKKAFIVTRVGDLLFIVGMAVLYTSLNGTSILNGASPLSIQFIITKAQLIALTIGKVKLGIVAVLLLGGAAGKSSQFPLHVWIPDAMEGPTTVSALIHAATMVTAGVYLVARVFPLFYYAAPFALYSVAILGSFTAAFAGTIGLVVNDIKRILAYSTISQIGYMLAAIGFGGIVSGSTPIGYAGVAYGMYHLIVHAMFKALLFMCAGAILLTLMDLRDTREMGGLWRKMPVTITLMFIGAITLAAVPPTAAYYSKDTIIDAAWVYFIASGKTVAGFLPWFFLSTGGALLTTLYTFRMFFRVALGGKPRSYLAEHARDPPVLVLVPLFFLAIPSLILGIVQRPFYSYVEQSSVLPHLVGLPVVPPLAVSLVPEIYLVIGGVVVTYFIYGTDRWTRMKPFRNPAYVIVRNKYFLDYLFTRVIAERAVTGLSGAFYSFENRYNSGVDTTGKATLSLSAW